MAAVKDIYRRVLRILVAEKVGELGLMTCVWGWISLSALLTPASGRAWAYAPTSCHGCGRRWRVWLKMLSVRRGPKRSGRKGHSITISSNNMDLKHWIWRGLHFTLSQNVVWRHLEMCRRCAVVFARENVRVWPFGNVFCVPEEEELQNNTKFESNLKKGHADMVVLWNDCFYVWLSHVADADNGQRWSRWW